MDWKVFRIVFLRLEGQCRGKTVRKFRETHKSLNIFIPLWVSLPPSSRQESCKSPSHPAHIHWPRHSQAPAIPPPLLNSVFVQKELLCCANPAALQQPTSACSPANGVCRCWGHSQTLRCSSHPTALLWGSSGYWPPLRQSRPGCSKQRVPSAHLVPWCLVEQMFPCSQYVLCVWVPS